MLFRSLSAELNTKILHFYPDAGALQNPDVMRHYREWFKSVKALGYTVKVASWEGFHLKGTDEFSLAARYAAAALAGDPAAAAARADYRRRFVAGHFTDLLKEPAPVAGDAKKAGGR